MRVEDFEFTPFLDYGYFSDELYGNVELTCPDCSWTSESFGSSIGDAIVAAQEHIDAKHSAV